MHNNRWKLQDAKNHFSELVDSAIKEGPQEVTRRGKHAVVVLSFELYQELTHEEHEQIIHRKFLYRALARRILNLEK